MDAETAKGIVDAADIEGIEIQLREDYSGRGMYGRTTSAIVVDSWGELLAGVARYAGDLDPIEQDEQIERLCEELHTLRSDSMGRGFVVY